MPLLQSRLTTASIRGNIPTHVEFLCKSPPRLFKKDALDAPLCKVVEHGTACDASPDNDTFTAVQGGIGGGISVLSPNP